MDVASRFKIHLVPTPSSTFQISSLLRGNYYFEFLSDCFSLKFCSLCYSIDSFTCTFTIDILCLYYLMCFFKKIHINAIILSIIAYIYSSIFVILPYLHWFSWYKSFFKKYPRKWNRRDLDLCIFICISNRLMVLKCMYQCKLLPACCETSCFPHPLQYLMLFIFIYFIIWNCVLLYWFLFSWLLVRLKIFSYIYWPFSFTCRFWFFTPLLILLSFLFKKLTWRVHIFISFLLFEFKVLFFI